MFGQRCRQCNVSVFIAAGTSLNRMPIAKCNRSHSGKIHIATCGAERHADLEDMQALDTPDIRRESD